MNVLNVPLCMLFMVLFAQISVTVSDVLLTLGIVVPLLAGLGVLITQQEHCFNNYYIPYNISALRGYLKDNLFGQPLAMELCHILQGHSDSIARYGGADKSLSISMHGWPGTGKNYVAEFIAKSLFKEGMASKYVKLYIGRYDFPKKELVSVYQSKLVQELKDLLESCPKVLIIFDEVNDIPAGVLNVLKPFMDYHSTVGGVNFRNAVFLFLSNVNGNEIADHFLALKKDRDDLVMADFDKVLSTGAYKTDGGFNEADMIYSQLIDHYIPFLPLEERHVEKCVRAEFKKLGNSNPTQVQIANVTSIVTYGPADRYPIFASAGCKRIRKQVSFINQKY